MSSYASKSSILVNDLALTVLIGVYPEERQAKQTLSLSLDITLTTKGDFNQKDDISATTIFDYEVITQHIQKKCDETKFYLLESLADYICDLIMENIIVEEVNLKLLKLNILGAQKVGVALNRKRKLSTNY